jgi:hypothetical protein
MHDRELSIPPFATSEETGRRKTIAIMAAFPLAALIAIASLGGILIPSLYVRESANWAAQAVGQDWMDLVLAVPWLTATGVLAMRGSTRALSLLAGGLLYTVYTFAIYALGMHFNAMFLVYCAVLGLSFFALSGIAADLAAEGRVPARSAQSEKISTRTAGFYLVAIGVLFAFAWLSEVVPAILWNDVPKSITEAGTPTNPVYVIDLSVILPLHLIAGIALLRGRPVGSILAPVVLAFGVLMASSIAGMMLLMRARGVFVNLGVAIGMLVIASMSGVVLSQLFRNPPYVLRPLPQ